MEATKSRSKHESEHELEPPQFQTPDVSISMAETSKNLFMSECISVLGNATEADEKGDYTKALHLYEYGLDMLMTLIKSEENEARKKMYKAKFSEIIERAEKMKELIKLSPADTSSPIIEEPKIDTTESELNEMEQSECETLLNITGVKCFSIVGDSKQLIADGTLGILKTKDQIELHLMQLEDFQFPLTKSIPCLRISPGYYVLPMPGNIFYGFVFPEGIPQQYISVFENIVDKLCILKKEDVKIPVPEKPQESSAVVVTTTSSQIVTTTKDKTVATLEKISSVVETGGKIAAEGINKASVKLAETVEQGGQYLKSKLVPNGTPIQVNPKLATTLKTAKHVGPVAVKLSAALVKGLVKVAEQVGTAVAESIQETEFGKKLSADSRFKGPKVDAAKNLGSKALYAISDVWDSLENAGRILLKQTSATTVSVVEHKYGREAADATEDGLSLAVDTVEVVYNVKQLGVKKVIRKIAKETAKSAVIGSKSQIEDSSQKQIEYHPL